MDSYSRKRFTPELSFKEIGERKKRSKQARKAVGMEKIDASGLEYRTAMDGNCLIFDCPHVHYFPSTQKCRFFKYNMTVKVGSERFVKWMKKNVGNVDAMPPAAEDGAKKKLTFGAYKGARVSELPDHYLKWIIQNFDQKSPWIQNATLELMRREKKDEEDGFIYDGCVPKPEWYAATKDKHGDAILVLKSGGSCFLYLDDAKIFSAVLNLTMHYDEEFDRDGTEEDNALEFDIRYLDVNCKRMRDAGCDILICEEIVLRDKSSVCLF